MNLLYRKQSLFYLFRKAVSAFLVVSFGLSMAVAPVTPSRAQLLPNLPAPGQMLWLSSGFLPPVLRGMTVHSENPLLFDFIVDRGQDKINNDLLKDESTKLIKYFLTAMTIPDKDAWVNLSPYEKDRIIPDALGQTEMGRQMLEQDYILKQLSSSLTNPDKELGQKFWGEVKARAQKQFGNTEVPLSTFNKVWIVPDGATVVEKQGFAYIAESRLKVMLDEDYLALSKLPPTPSLDKEGAGGVVTNSVSKLSTDVFRELILPQLNKELNEGKNFAPTRQVYQSVILAAWYKKALKDSLLGRIYADKSKVEGVESDVKDIKQKVYDQYLDAFKKGAYNVIKEDSADSEAIPRKYFSGGLQLGMTLNSNDLKIVRGSADINRAASAIVQAGDQIALVSSSAAESKGEQSQLVSNTLDNQRAGRITDIYNAVYAKMGKKYLDPFGNPLATSVEYGTFAPSSLYEVLPLFRQFGVGPGKRFVDLGSGDGRVALAAALLGANAIGVEKDPQLVAIAKEAFARVAQEINVPWSVGFYRQDISQYSLQGPNAPDVIYYYQGGGVEVDEAVRSKVMAGTTNPNTILIVAGFAREYDLFPELTRVTTPEFEDQNWIAVYKVPAAASSGVTVDIPNISPFQFISVLEENLGLRINYLGNDIIQLTGISDSSRYQRIHDAAMKMIAGGSRRLLQDKIFSDFSSKFHGGRAQREMEIQKDAINRAISSVLDALAVIKPLTAPVTASGLRLNVSKITEYNEAELQFLSVVVDRIAEKQKQIDPQAGNITDVRVAPLPRSQDGLTFFSLISYGEKQFIVKSRRENTLGREAHLQNQYDVMQKLNANGGHPSVVPVIDFGSENGRTYLVTGFAPGKDLAQIVKLPRLNVNLEKIVDFAVNFAQAVKFVHDQGVVIRDLNPYNVRIASDGSVTLFDFDASMQVSYDWAKDPYSLHNLRGTDYYSDGFYLNPDKTPDFQLDIAQIGVDLFYYATGYYPIDEDTNYRDPLPLQRVGQYPGLRKIIERTVASRENGRYKNVDELLTDLKALQSSLKADGTSAASSSIFGEENYLSRPLADLEKAYGLSDFLDKRKGEEKVTALLVGVGRGIAVMQLALKYPNLEIVAVNNQEGMWNDNKATAVAAQLNNVVYTPAQIQNARARVRVIETLDIENAQAREVELNKFADQNGKFDMVFFETLVTMYLKDQVQTIEELFNERVKVGGVYGFEISRAEARPELVSLLSEELPKAFAKSGEVKSVDSAQLVPRFFTVVRTQSKEVTVPLKKVSSIRHRPGVVSNFDQPVYTTEYELVPSEGASAASSSVLADKYNRPGLDQIEPSYNSAVTPYDLSVRARELFALVDQTPAKLERQYSKRDSFVLQEVISGKVSTSNALNELIRALSDESIADENISDLTGEGLVRWLYDRGTLRNVKERRVWDPAKPEEESIVLSVPDVYYPLKETARQLAKVIEGFGAEAQFKVLRTELQRLSLSDTGDNSKLYLLAAAGVPDIGPALKTIYEDLLKGSRAKYAGDDFLRILNFTERTLALKISYDSKVMGDFLWVSDYLIPLVTEIITNEQLRFPAFAQSNEVVIKPMPSENATEVYSLTWGEKKYVLKIRRPNTGMGLYLRNQVEILSRLNGSPQIARLVASKIDPGKEYYLVTEYLPEQDLDKQIESRGPMTELNQALDFALKLATAVKFVHQKGVVIRDLDPSNIRISSDSVFLHDFDASMALPYDWVQDKNSLKRTTGRDNYPDGFYKNNDVKPDFQLDIANIGVVLLFVTTGYYPPASRTVKMPLPLDTVPFPELQKIIERAVAPRDQGRYKNIDEFLKDLRALQGTLGAGDVSSASSGVADGDFISNELGAVVDRILKKFKVSAEGEVLSAVREGIDYIALDAWWRGESGWAKEIAAADGSSVFVISQPVLNKLLVKHLQRYPKSVDIFSAMGVRDVQGQITLSPEFVKSVNEEVLYSSGAGGGAASSSGVIDKQGFVVPTRIPFSQIRTVEAFSEEIGGKFYSVNYGEYRGRGLTIFWSWEAAGQRIKTYILAGDYRERLPEAIKLFETKSNGRVQSRYAGFDPLTGKEYTIHDYYPLQFVEPLWTWLQEGNTVENSEAEIIAAHDAALNVSSSAVGGINFDPTLLNLQIRRDGQGVPLPLPQQNLENININGLYPVIINILPVNVQTLPLLGQLETAPDVALSKG